METVPDIPSPQVRICLHFFRAHGTVFGKNTGNMQYFPPAGAICYRSKGGTHCGWATNELRHSIKTTGYTGPARQYCRPLAILSSVHVGGCCDCRPCPSPNTVWRIFPRWCIHHIPVRRACQPGARHRLECWLALAWRGSTSFLQVMLLAATIKLGLPVTVGAKLINSLAVIALVAIL